MTDKNELFKKLCKLGVPINTLIGAARSANNLHKYHGVPIEWEESLIKHAEAAKEAWDCIVALIESLHAPMIAQDVGDDEVVKIMAAGFTRGFFEGKRHDELEVARLHALKSAGLKIVREKMNNESNDESSK